MPVCALCTLGRLKTEACWAPPQRVPQALPRCTLQGFEGLTQRIADYQAERDARAAAVREAEEERKLRECTFAPDISRRRVQAKVRQQGPRWMGRPVYDRRRLSAGPPTSRPHHSVCLNCKAALPALGAV